MIVADALSYIFLCHSSGHCPTLAHIDVDSFGIYVERLPFDKEKFIVLQASRCVQQYVKRIYYKEFTGEIVG